MPTTMSISWRLSRCRTSSFWRSVWLPSSREMTMGLERGPTVTAKALGSWAGWLKPSSRRPIVR